MTKSRSSRTASLIRMTRSLLALLVVFCCLRSRLVAQETELQLWPDAVPGESELSDEFKGRVAALEKKNVGDRVFGVSRPTLAVRLADPDKANGAAVLVCPGGGYNILAWNKEGTEVADWLNSIGVHAFVLKYRVPRRNPDFASPPLQDAQRAIRMIRARADEWHVDANRLGVLGFSAGGNLIVNLALAETAAYEPVDATDSENFHPDFMIPIYAAYLGAPDNDQQLNPALKIDSATPPTFLTVTQDDKNRGMHAALLFAKLTAAGVPAEVHVYTRGGHGYGLRPSDNPVHEWTARCADWMAQMKLLPNDK
jgi:acetyl esterase/lipase